MEVDAGLVELVDERFAAIKRQHFPSYLGLLRSWRESLVRTEEWMVRKEQEFTQYADNVIAHYQREPPALQDHNYCTSEEDNPFVPHNCSEKCWVMGCVVNSPSKFSALSLPLLLGWRRVLLLRPPSEGNKTDSYYVAPCGRRLRTMDEVNQFLESTCVSIAECNIFITNFTFDPLCSLICPPYNAKSSGAKVFIPDITCEAEPIPITCVNSLTSEPPEHFHYISHREVGPAVHVESDPGFLVSCSCPDNCANRSTCECWQLTIQEASAIGSAAIGPGKLGVGYQHCRLKKPLRSAIYECNSRCACGVRCGNRVVQRGVEHHLQVFRTEDRGWGLRTLRDIPAGSFICTYVGQIFPEHTLEGQGVQQPTPISDEYFAELDYIEVMEHHKEGYESEVEMPSDHEDSSSSTGDESFILDSISSSTFKVGTVGEATGGGQVSEDDRLSLDSISSTLSNISLCSSTVISPIPSPTATPSQPHPLATSLQPYLLTTPLQPHPLTTPSQQYPLVPLHTPSHVPTSPSQPSHPTTGQPSPDGAAVLSSEPPPVVTPPCTALPNRLSNLWIEQQITRSPRDYVVPISPRKLHGMKTRQHFKEDFSYIIDARERGNIGRYINHSCSPNMFVQNVFVDTHDLRFPWVAFFARNRIKALQEVTWDYSYEVGSVEGKVIYCRCKAPNCRGRLL